MIRFMLKRFFPNFYKKFYQSYKFQRILWYIKTPHPIKYIIYILIIFIFLVFIWKPYFSPDSVKRPIASETLEQGFEKGTDDMK